MIIKTKSALETLENLLLEFPKEETPILDAKKVAPDLDYLTSEQKEAFDLCVKFIREWFKDESVYDCFQVTGYAGTGKTTLITRLCHHLLHNTELRILFCAPTHKAVEVLRRKSPFRMNDQVDYKTIHSAWSLIQTGYSKTGEPIFEKNEKKMGSEPIREFDIIIIDEGSQIDKKLLAYIMAERHKHAIIFVGDPGQIPPVKGGGVCPLYAKTVIEKFKIGQAHLKTVMRQALDSPVLRMATEIREGKFKTNIHNHYEISQDGKSGIFFLSRKKGGKEAVDRILMKLFASGEFKEDSDFARILAYHNKDTKIRKGSVEGWNTYMRKIVFGEDVGRLVEGEMIVLREPIIEYDPATKETQILYPNNQELKIKEVGKIFTKNLIALDGQTQSFKFYFTEVLGICPRTGIPTNRQVRILHEDELKRYDWWMKYLKKEARMNYNRMGGGAWKSYQQAKNAFVNFLYGFAITAHKSQGSTYKTSILAWYDLIKAPAIERKAIQYVAASRASNYSIVLMD